MALKISKLLKLPNDVNILPRALSMAVAKLIMGTCPQLVFQAVLLGGYTPWPTDFVFRRDFPFSQAFSILSSALIIAKTTTEIVIYQRENKFSNKYKTVNEWLTVLANPSKTGEGYVLKEEKEKQEKTIYDRIEDMALKAEKALKEALKAFMVILQLIPFILSSLIFNTGTLILTIMVTEWYSAIYIGTVLLLNFAVSIIFPYSVVQRAEEKLRVTYKHSIKDEAEKLKKKRFARAIFATWANLFAFLRPVENMSYHKIIHAGLLMPLRFLVNMVTLIIVYVLTWTWKNGPLKHKHKHTNFQTIALVISFAVVSAAGILNLIEFRYFYKRRPKPKPGPSLQKKEAEAQKEEIVEKESSGTSLLESEQSEFEHILPWQPNLESSEQCTLYTTRKSKQSVTSVRSRTSITSASQFTTIQEGVQLEGALADERNPLLPITEGQNVEESVFDSLGAFTKSPEEADELFDDSLDNFTKSPGAETSIFETTEVAPDGTIVTTVKKISTVSKISVNGKDVDLDNLDDPNSNLTDEEKRQIKLAFQDKGMLALSE